MNDSASIRRTGVDLGKGEFQLEEAERIRSLASEAGGHGAQGKSDCPSCRRRRRPVGAA
jgi:hypothetical protein